MATATQPTKPATSPTTAAFGGDRLYRMSLVTYHRIADAGILGPRDRVVLLDGVLVTKTTKSDPHITAVGLTCRALDAIIPAGWFVSKEDPIALPGGPTGHDSEPEPDITVVRGAVRDYSARKPHPGDIALVVEVAESSLREDRNARGRYAWAGIPTAWIVNLVSRGVEVSTEPTGPGPDPRYRTTRTLDAEAAVPVVLEGREIGAVAVRDLLP